MVKAASTRLLDELPSSEDMSAVISSLPVQSDRDVALLGAAYVEHALTNLLKAKFRKLAAKEEEALFDAKKRGILSTFSAKARIGYAIRAIDKHTYDVIILISYVRNAFAHSLHRIDFTTSEIGEDCRQISKLMSNLMASKFGYTGGLVLPEYKMDYANACYITYVILLGALIIELGLDPDSQVDLAAPFPLQRKRD